MTNVKAQLKSYLTIIEIFIAIAILNVIMGLIGRWLGYEGMMP